MTMTQSRDCEHGLSASLCVGPGHYPDDRHPGDSGWTMTATPAQAHAEWHRNSGVPMGQPGCPQDACHLPDFYFPETVESGTEGAVKCGNRKASHVVGSYHLGVAEVRSCYETSAEYEATMAQIYPNSSGVGVPSPAPEVATPEVDEERVAQWQAAPREPFGARWATIPVGGRGFGWYALEDEDRIRFFRVERPTEGKWAGMTFIKEQAGDAYHPIEPKARGYSYLTAIAADPEFSGMLYATKMERCTRCHRSLTDEESRARGMGPECWSKSR